MTDSPYAPPQSPVDESSAPATQIYLAHRLIRLGASLIDSLAFAIPGIPIMFMLGIFDNPYEEPTLQQNLELFLVFQGLFLLLQGYLLTQGQTIGKRLLRLRIVSVADGRVPPFWRIWGVRYLAIPVLALALYPWPLLAMIPGILDVLFIFGGSRRCLHDYLAGTRVITWGVPGS